MFDVEYGQIRNHSNTDILITLGNTSAKNKRIECTIVSGWVSKPWPNTFLWRRQNLILLCSDS